mmetsp:Transcript_1084/g.2694  ORF Transcript_1084/g.2694 Transcript_1084/m.2694 type:complete len:308 (-) Transcript_1084:39-962(-)
MRHAVLLLALRQMGGLGGDAPQLYPGGLAHLQRGRSDQPAPALPGAQARHRGRGGQSGGGRAGQEGRGGRRHHPLRRAGRPHAQGHRRAVRPRLPLLRGRPLHHPPMAARDQVHDLGREHARVEPADGQDLHHAVRRADANGCHLLALWPGRHTHQLPPHLGEHSPLRQLRVAPGSQDQGRLPLTVLTYSDLPPRRALALCELAARDAWRDGGEMHREVARWWRDGGEVAARSEVAQPDGRQVVRSAPLLQQRVCHSRALPERQRRNTICVISLICVHTCVHACISRAREGRVRRGVFVNGRGIRGR